MLETERAGLAGAVAQKEAELVGLGEELVGARSRLARERETAAKATETLQNQLNDKVSGSEPRLRLRACALGWLTESLLETQDEEYLVHL